MKFTFAINKFERIGESNVYKIQSYEIEAPTFEEAKAKVVIPEGHRIFYSFSHEKVDIDTV